MDEFEIKLKNKKVITIKEKGNDNKFIDEGLYILPAYEELYDLIEALNKLKKDLYELIDIKV